MIEKLTEETVKEFIKTGIVVIKGVMENCPKCIEYAPVFETVAGIYPDIKFGELLIAREGSEFKRAYMKAKIGEPMGAPCTFVFKNGELTDRVHGKMTKEELIVFIHTGEKPERKPAVKNTELKDLFAAKGELITNLEMLQTRLNEVNLKIKDLIGDDNADNRK